MSDPFVQRMIARTQARKNILGKVDGSDKENYKHSSDKTSSTTSKDITSTVTSRVYKTTNLDEVVSEIMPNDTKQVLQESSSQTLLLHQHSQTSVSVHNASDLPSNLSNSSPTRKPRFQHLAQRSKRMDEWEDDYTYHSVSGHSTKEVETVGLGLHDRSNNVTKCKQARISNASIQDSSKNLYACQDSGPTSCYYFGENDMQSKNITKNLHFTKNSCNSKFGASSDSNNASFFLNHSSNASLHASNIKTNTQSPTLPCIVNSTSKSSTTSLPSTSKTLTPTKCLAWDRQLLKSLEAQGFTPSPSRSRLAYDFRDRSPLKETPISPSPGSEQIRDKRNFTKEIPQRQLEEKSQMEPPKIVSVHSKSNVILDQTRNDNFEIKKNPLQRERSPSPGKVRDLKSHWEQHIRNASPERNVERPRSVSPVRKTYTRTSRSRSPPNLLINPANKSHSSQFPSSKSSHSLRSEGMDASTRSDVQRRICDSRARVSPPKPGPCVEVVKGEVPMPETTPIVKDPSASVLERVAAFSSLSARNLVTKDPAELSLQDRKNLFEKGEGNALVPKAPFGQCVSEKKLRTTSGGISQASKSYENPKPPKSTSKPCSQTFIASSNFTNVKSCSEFANSVVEAQKRRFEKVEDNWRENEINAKVMDERKSEMDQLLNRFRKPKPKINSAARDVPQPLKEMESDTEYPESEESSGEYEASTRSMSASLGPPKPPRTGVFEASPSSDEIPLPPPMPHSPRSPSKRLNSTELDGEQGLLVALEGTEPEKEESYPISPSKEYIPKIKPGCLFPSLSDIDSHSEAVESDEENRDSSFAESVLTCASADSLGSHIQAMAQGSNKVATRQLSTIQEGPLHRGSFDAQSLTESTQEALGAIDDALEEAFNDDDETTPPKRSRQELESGKKVAYKTPKIYHESSSSSDSSEVPLAHSISMYRKQRPAEIAVTPVRQIIRKPEFTSPSKESPVSPSVTIGSRIKELQEEEEHQLTVISQASSAITVVSQRPEQHGTMQHIEAEKLLLVATQKRQSALHEIQRLKAEGALGKKNYWAQDEDSCRGSISIGKITLPLKQDFLAKSRNESGEHHFLVLVKHRDLVITSQLQTTPGCIVDGAITFPNLMSLHNLTSDFNISLEVYGFKVEPLHSSGFKKEHSRLKLTPLKRLQKECKSSPAVSSPGGPFSVRTSSFQLIGFAHLNINTLTRNAWTLEKVPFNSPMNGHLLMRVSVAMEGGVSEKSFLTMFDDVGGFGAWNRRWCVLNGAHISYWSYPDHENSKESLGCLDLRMCTTRKVELVSRDVCARQFTFQLTFVRPLRAGDRSDLIHEVKGNTFITRILMSADSKEERILWCNKLNKALANIRAWDPEALKPEDFYV